MKCPQCNEKMYLIVNSCPDTRGNFEMKYVCPKCAYEIKNAWNDLVYRAPFFKPDNSVTVTDYGWICPKCGAVLSPSIKECPYCTPHKSTCGTINEFPIKAVPTTDVTSQAQVNTKVNK